MTMPNTPKLPEDVEQRFDEWRQSGQSYMNPQDFVDGWHKSRLKQFIAQELSTLKAQVRKEIEGLIEKYQKSEEVTVNGQRFLIVGGLKKKFGYPFPDTKEKYLIREIKQALSILKEE